VFVTGFTLTEEAKINPTETAPIRTDLTRLLRRFENCAPDQNTRNYFRIYLTGHGKMVIDLVRQFPRYRIDFDPLASIYKSNNVNCLGL